MNWKDIIKMFDKIEIVTHNGCSVGVNNSVIFSYKNEKVAKEVAKKIKMFKGI